MLFQQKLSLPNLLWDLWCCISIIGIWPRFIEPNLICTTSLEIPIERLPSQFNGFKILFLSDIHISDQKSKKFLMRVAKKIQRERPNLILIGGDFFTYAKPEGTKLLLNFLQMLHIDCNSFHGIFACLGNHDYEEYVTVTDDGLYRIKKREASSIVTGLKRLFSKRKILNDTAHFDMDKKLSVHPELKTILEKSGVTLLENEIVTLLQDGMRLQIGATGDIMAGKCDPEKLFSKWDRNIPGIILSHNPDSWKRLQNYPGDLYLFGHTHGGQVNLPFMRKKIIPILHSEMRRGLFIKQDPQRRSLYVSRGIGSTFPFRWFSPPEIVSITLKQEASIPIPVDHFKLNFGLTPETNKAYNAISQLLNTTQLP